jgi:hypothetical protein
MSYGFKWNEAKQRYYVGGDAGGCFVRQVSEMQPRGHWVRGDERAFRDRGMYTWGPSLVERTKRRLDGWRWHEYKDRKVLEDLGAE